MKRLAILLATGLGLGYSPVASGTFGTLPGVVIAFAMANLAWPMQTLIAVVLCIAAVPICQIGEDHFGRKDDGRIVADEYLTFPICLIGLPLLENLWLLPVAFVTARVLDIIKPPPARQSQAITGGLGIAIDDVISTLYALGLNHLIFWLWLKYGSELAGRWIG